MSDVSQFAWVVKGPSEGTLPAERPRKPGGLKRQSQASRFKRSNLVEPRMNHSNDFKPPYRLSVVVGEWFTDGS